MNERIKRLALEARIAYYSKNGAYEDADEGLSVIPSTQSLEKFAELIVRECAELSANSQYVNTKSEYYEGFNEALVYVGNKIKNHFGVEE